MVRCSRCILTDRFSNISFDEAGLCSVCGEWDRCRTEQADFSALEAEFRARLGRSRRKNPRHDVVLGFSAGKDSIYSLFLLKRKFELEPLLVYYDNGYQTDSGRNLMREVVDRFDCDLLVYRPRHEEYSEILRSVYCQIGEVCLHCDVGIWSTLFKAARQHDIDLIVTGGGATEGITKTDRDHPEIDILNYARSLYGGLSGIDFDNFDINPDEVEPIQTLMLGDYFVWNHDTLKKTILDELELRFPWDSGTGHIHHECRLCRLTDHIRYRKRGFPRNDHAYSALIRTGSMTREEALQLSECDADSAMEEPEVLEDFCRRAKLSKEEFYRILNDPTVRYRPPWYHGEQA